MDSLIHAIVLSKSRVIWINTSLILRLGQFYDTCSRKILGQLSDPTLDINISQTRLFMFTGISKLERQIYYLNHHIMILCLLYDHFQ